MKTASLNNVSAVETAEEASNRGPDLWTGVALSINEIATALTTANRAGRDMRAAQTEKSQADLKAACEQIAEHANAAHILAKHLASVVARHQARKPRI